MTVFHKQWAILAIVLVGCGTSETDVDGSGVGPKTTQIEASLPSALADVVVTMLTYSNGNFTATVTNQGEAATPAGVWVGVGYSVDGTFRTWGSVMGPLAAGASIDIGTQGGQYVMPNGSHSITAFVDDVNRFAESAENNNTFSTTLVAGDTQATSVPTGLSDVVVTAVSFANGVFSSTVKNQGSAATPAGVAIGVGYFADGVYRTWGAVMGPLAAGASVIIGTNGDSYPLSSGTHSLLAHVDDVNRFAESDESNNRLSMSVSIAGSTYTPPVLVNPVNPMDFGAKCDGLTDDSLAFQKAINAGDVLVPAKTCLLNKTMTISTSHKHIECSPGTVLSHTDPFAGYMFRIVAFGDPLDDVSIVNCHFLGTNTVAPQYFEADNRHWDIPVMAQNTVDNLYIAGNTFERFFGQTMVQNYAPVYSGSGARIEYNTFKSCGYYGAALVASVNGYIAHNTLIDCALGVENDNATQATGGNIIEYNTLTAVYGYGAPDMTASTMLTGGGAGGADYSKNIVRYNSVSGIGSAAKGNLHSIIYERNQAGKAQYIGNVCGAGCEVIQ